MFRDCKIDGEEVGTFTKYIYRTTVKRAKERLDALGYGINNFEKTFNNKMFQAIDYSAFLYHLHVDYDEYAQETELRIKKNVTFKKWKNAMRKIINYEVANGNISWHGTVSDVTIRTECDKIIFYSLKDEDNSMIYALNPEIIHRAFIYRLILENCTDDTEVLLDFSNLAFGDDDCIPKALEATENIEKTIVLVEGTSDKDILGVKGEEYTTVIAFGLLYGYVPHWNIINNKPLRYQTDETKKLLYVVCSCAKKNLYLFSEQGRTTKKGWELPPTKEIESVAYMYDDLEISAEDK